MEFFEKELFDEVNSDLTVELLSIDDLLAYIDVIKNLSVRNVMIQGATAQWVTDNDYQYLLCGTWGKYNTGISFMLYQSGIEPCSIYIGRIDIAIKSVVRVQKINTSAIT